MLDAPRDRRAGHSCPTCHRPAARMGNPARPFCSLTCRLVDLGRWLDGNFRVPGEPLPVECSPDRRPTAAA